MRECQPPSGRLADVAVGDAYRRRQCGEENGIDPDKRLSESSCVPFVSKKTMSQTEIPIKDE